MSRGFLRAVGSGTATIMMSVYSQTVLAAETDQFLVWDVELRDSAPALNTYLNQETERFLAEENALHGAEHSAALVTQDLYLYLFRSILDSRLRHFVMTAPDIDRYPPSTISYPEHLEMSIYSAKSFPFILPMARTIRIGDVYLGIDKLSHFFGFGRRYFKRYVRLREEGYPEDVAMEKTVEWGMWYERYLVGNLTDGIYSYADLEANFQGMMMARSFSEGPTPLLVRTGDKWTLARPIDIRDFVNPGFDESYNCSRFMGTRRSQVMHVLESEVCPKRTAPLVQARFERYQKWKPSFSQQFVDRKLGEQGWTPHTDAVFDLWCASGKAEGLPESPRTTP
ncbi:MAG: hypothetical protein K1Y02_19090 [Candidatus Hydrogenedentes bacterium]|nr:hypothetical protein [Candidatus Hydrogenedentota bacterium]